MSILFIVLGVVALIFGIILGWSAIPSGISTTIIYVVAIGGLLYLFGSIAKGTSGKTEWSRVGVILVLAVFNIFFWSGFEQAGTTFNVFARDNTMRMVGSWEIPATWFQSINALYIVAFAPLFSILWVKLDKIGLNPNTPMKFAIGMGLLALGFVAMAIAYSRSTSGEQMVLVSPLWLALVYLLHTFGELCLSPIGLSMVTKLSPAKLVSTMMGVWMGSWAAGNFVASQMKAISLRLEDVLGREIQVFWLIAVQSGIIALILVALSPWLKRMMHGIK